MEGESGVTRRMTDELHSSDIPEYQIEGESGFTGSMIDEFLLRKSNKIKGKVKGVLLDVSLMNFFLRISNEV